MNAFACLIYVGGVMALWSKQKLYAFIWPLWLGERLARWTVSPSATALTAMRAAGSRGDEGESE